MKKSPGKAWYFKNFEKANLHQKSMPKWKIIDWWKFTCYSSNESSKNSW